MNAGGFAAAGRVDQKEPNKKQAGKPEPLAGWDEDPRNGLTFSAEQQKKITLLPTQFSRGHGIRLEVRPPLPRGGTSGGLVSGSPANPARGEA